MTTDLSEANADGGVEVATLGDPERADADGGGPRTPVLGGDPRVVSVTLDAGETIPEHEHPGTRVLFLVRSGTASVTVAGSERTLDAGSVARFDGGDGVAVEAETDCAALVVLSEAEEEN
ncbi:cupin domain-containing protein [Halobaculum sp. EA56]|uniref:cupin domain-containing protein n=1 Tax=Halobaculum sp. EA56 TaxID=3421648 RepID=UPI003EBB1162